VPAALPPLALVVEDERVVAKIICRHLDNAGYRSVPYASALSALELVAKGTIPDVMVLDVRLPDLPGPTLALRVHQRYPRVPVLFTSGWVDGLADPDSLGAMRWKFLPKPFDGDSLVGAVRWLVGGEPASVS